jgi:hypothetical protein
MVVIRCCIPIMAQVGKVLFSNKRFCAWWIKKIFSVKRFVDVSLFRKVRKDDVFFSVCNLTILRILLTKV